MDALVAVLEKVPGQVEHLLLYVAAATRRGGDEFEQAREVAQQHYITSFSSPCTGAIHGACLGSTAAQCEAIPDRLFVSPRGKGSLH